MSEHDEQLPIETAVADRLTVFTINAVGVAGYIALAAGLYLIAGLGLALTIMGGITLALAIAGALRC